jgi:hypothetical protein
MTWNPLLTGAEREKALAAALALSRTLPPAGASDQRSASLASGAAGIAVCHAMIAHSCSDNDAGDRASACLDSAIGVLASRPLSLSLFSGFTGIAWAADLVDRLVAGPLIPGAGADRNDEIDVALARAIARYPEQGPYDLIDGLTGIGAYALARWPRPAAVECLEGVLAQLARRARQDEHGSYWFTSPAQLLGPRRDLYPDGGVDVGLAHGMAGVIPLLARASALGLGEPWIRPLLGGAVGWLLAHLADSPAGRTTPSFVAVDLKLPRARTAWCYGDPGVAAALLLAGRDAGEPAWQEAATDLALRAAHRPAGATGVSDGAVCHGSAGLAHLFARMHHLTGNDELADAAAFWLGRTVAACDQYLSAEAEAVTPWSGPGLLEGAAGIALVLLAACLPAEPAWDQMLLVAAPLAVPVNA